MLSQEHPPPTLTSIFSFCPPKGGGGVCSSERLEPTYRQTLCQNPHDNSINHVLSLSPSPGDFETDDKSNRFRVVVLSRTTQKCCVVYAMVNHRVLRLYLYTFVYNLHDDGPVEAETCRDDVISDK